ncbi:hypothetical protein [Schinkia azotoformans]|uniref:hypothetical protein n=1 Tax=Schinkia azotoformans TaxID=1454 RepID=UPI002DB6AF11|nr:hypothetical protein [Schinkia azotoformans]MEC1744136.1 hypothetical protein [Schinkia azotoformans]
MLVKIFRFFTPSKLSRLLKNNKKESYKFNLYRIESNINILLDELDLKEKWSGKKIDELNEIDIEYFLALITSNIERGKAIQFTTLFIAALISILFFIWSSDWLINYITTETRIKDSIVWLLVFVISLYITGSVFEKKYKNDIANYTLLKELLQIYKNNKF